MKNAPSPKVSLSLSQELSIPMPEIDMAASPSPFRFRAEILSATCSRVASEKPGPLSRISIAHRPSEDYPRNSMRHGGLAAVAYLKQFSMKGWTISRGTTMSRMPSGTSTRYSRLSPNLARIAAR